MVAGGAASSPHFLARITAHHHARAGLMPATPRAVLGASPQLAHQTFHQPSTHNMMQAMHPGMGNTAHSLAFTGMNATMPSTMGAPGGTMLVGQNDAYAAACAHNSMPHNSGMMRPAGYSPDFNGCTSIVPPGGARATPLRASSFSSRLQTASSRKLTPSRSSMGVSDFGRVVVV